MIPTSAGFLPCPVCVPWSKRPEYMERSSSTLVSQSDLKNLKKALEIDTDRDMATARASSDPNGPTDSISASAGASSGSRAKQTARKEVKMTEERRRAIQRGMQGRGPLPEDHKRRISASIRERYKSDQACDRRVVQNAAACAARWGIIRRRARRWSTPASKRSPQTGRQATLCHC